MGQNEKYISIEYTLWNDYYKPLEDLNKKLLERIEELKANSKIYLYISCANYRSARIEHTVIGFLNIDIREALPPAIQISKVELLQAINTTINNENYFRVGRDRIKIFNEDEIAKAKDIIRDYEASEIKFKAAVLELEQEKKKIPAFVRWLFNIKINP
jgi:hypothetical protein